MKLLLILPILLIASVTCFATGWELDKGSKEIGGSFSFESMSGELYEYDGDGTTFIKISPTVQFFIQPRFSMGGKIEFTNWRQGFNKIRSLALGPAVTQYFGAMDSNIWPFIGVNYLVLYEFSEYTGGFNGYNNYVSNGTSLQLMGGVMFKLVDNFALKGSIFYNMDTIDDDWDNEGSKSGNVIGLAVGFAGFIF